MAQTEADKFRGRFTFAGRLLLLLNLVVGAGTGWLLLVSIAERGFSFPIFVPFAIGFGIAALLFGLMRIIYRLFGIQFWSDTELGRRSSGRIDGGVAEEPGPARRTIDPP